MMPNRNHKEWRLADFSQRLYARLERELDCCAQMGGSPADAVQCGFYKADRYWRFLQPRIAAYRFGSDAEEIHFFKHCKPLFTARITYYNLCYAALLFQPEEPKAARRFWCYEAQRHEQFVTENRAFYRYYSECMTEFDQEWFLRRNLGIKCVASLPIFDDLTNTLTQKDYIVSLFISLDLYRVFAAEQLIKLGGK